MKDYQNYVPRYFYLYLFLFTRANSVFNPIIYATTNTQFRKSLKSLFYSIIQKKERILTAPKDDNAHNLDRTNLFRPNENPEIEIK